jgi:hypothetical protein
MGHPPLYKHNKMAKRKVAGNSLAGAAMALAISPEKLQEALDAHLENSIIKLERDRAIDNEKWHKARLHEFTLETQLLLERLMSDTKPTKGEVAQLIQYAKNVHQETEPNNYL